MLEIKDLNVIFHQGTINENHVLKDINLTIHDHDFITVIGSNGAGKSTLLNAICGSIEITKGEISLNGTLLNPLAEHQRALKIGRLFQDTKMGTAPSLSIEENIALAMSRGQKRLLGMAVRKKDQALFKEKLKDLSLNLEDRLRTPAGLLSGGQRQALALIMATIVPPQLLLLDEHTAALDPKSSQIILNLTEKIIKENQLPALMITHNIEHALKYGNRTIVLSQGRIIADLDQNQRSQMSVQNIMQLYKNEQDVLSDRILLGTF